MIRSVRPNRRGRPWALLAVSLLASAPRHVRAWDPSTTHVALVRETVVRSQMHPRWMESSGLRRGVFSGLALDPNALDEAQRATLIAALASAHAGNGSVAAGGPGACPPPTAPPETRSRCVEGDRWEMTALGWIRLGVMVEITPRDRLLHHFTDRDDPDAMVWRDPELPSTFLRGRIRRHGSSVSSRVTGTSFNGEAASARAWLEDTTDPWAPPAALEHLRRATLAPTRAEREQHVVLGLLGVGALLHVVADLGVPAHARGDLTAFFLPLSGSPRDRGLPLQEFARLAYGRHALPIGQDAVDDPPDGTPSTDALIDLVFGTPDHPGIARFTSSRFFSESTLPRSRPVDPALPPDEAATAILGDHHGLAPAEIEGATLTPWPSASGYLVSSTGRGLATFRWNDRGEVVLGLDEAIYRDQAAQLMPRITRVGARILDVVFVASPVIAVDFDHDLVDLDLSPFVGPVRVHVLGEDASGVRERLQVLSLNGGGRVRLTDVAWTGQDTIVLAVEFAGLGGHPQIVEATFQRPSPADPPPAAPEARPSLSQPRIPEEIPPAPPQKGELKTLDDVSTDAAP